jgi:hypothetical protein
VLVWNSCWVAGWPASMLARSSAATPAPAKVVPFAKKLTVR